jgi:hypothetical protein
MDALHKAEVTQTQHGAFLKKKVDKHTLYAETIYPKMTIPVTVTVFF